MNTQKHTLKLLPLRLHNPAVDELSILYPNGCSLLEWPKNYTPEDLEHAAYIVQAVNHHEALVSALKQTVERLETWWKAAGSPAHETELHLAEMEALLSTLP